jgi:hypothetical protein
MDIVERLRGTQPMTGTLEDMLAEAAAEIERLRAALTRIATHDGIDCLAADPSKWSSQVAADALRSTGRARSVTGIVAGR